jgi:formylglycine-generating enzyme required for sulfatase activity
VLVSPGQKEGKEVFHFAHRSFQEYLAARHLMQRCAQARSYAELCSLIQSKPDAWRVPGVLAGDVLAETEAGYRLLWDVLDALLEDEIDPQASAADPRWWAVWLASQLLQSQSMLKGNLGRCEKAVCNGLRDWIVALIETPQALEPVDRAVCGRALSLLGDPRPGVGTQSVQITGRSVAVPVMAWSDPIPAATVWLGEEGRSYNPRHQVTFDQPFQLSRYLVTHQQFQSFIDSADYDQPAWWADFPEAYRPQPMRDQRFPYANHPRETVSWYQAVAFSRWLTAQHRQLGWLPEGYTIRLPTEWEWEYAARGSDERIFPYNDDYDPKRMNSDDSRIGMTSAVGLFPDGASPFGLHDMSGNLNEWCLSDYESNKLNIYNNGKGKVLRGGSWGDSGTGGFRCASRNRVLPHGGFNGGGFRLALSVL